ncbi:uncharacterized protein LOC126355989 [Schistocerca gregaria]|uniref:uncharacterized protein LOC126355989 n=1 Tax=Schistocerca gregaria TaxID=7010 RepID=UPI00211F3FF0|nr:uncharacterized protein LOC126355989 [Schistocerca gregaria]
MPPRRDRGSRATTTCAAAAAAMRCLAVALLCCACADAAAGTRGSACIGSGPALEELLRRNYSEHSEGMWSCADRGPRYRDATLAFQFNFPGLELIHCIAADTEVLDFSKGEVYFVMLSGSADSPPRYKCKMCDSRWYTLDRDPMLQRPLVQCRGFAKLELELEGHPAEGGTRLDGVRCHTAWRKGCDRGYTWCHGKCCRREALFYYPQLQQPIGTGSLLTAQTAGSRDAPLLHLLTKAAKTAVTDC